MKKKPVQTTSHLLMVRPVNFHYNQETADSNEYMHDSSLSETEQNYLAQQEFDRLANTLAEKLTVNVVEDTPAPVTPDSIFPNNWITMHPDGTLITYPMEAENRRAERKQTVLNHIDSKYQINKRIHLESLEDQGHFLEGTGSVVFDHQQRIAYACLSSRTARKALDELLKHIDYQAVTFHATHHHQPIYHTNVMMSVGSHYVSVCLEAVEDPKEKQILRDSLENSGKKIIEITRAQVDSFSGNILELMSTAGDPLLAMSESAWQAYDLSQQQILESSAEIIALPIPTIEKHAGGSVRCMLAEIFLPRP